MFEKYLQSVRQKAPLIHNITNYVTANDCANMLLAAGASPIMADAPEEAAEITANCQGLNLNMGTLSQSRLTAMLAAGRKASEMKHPIILDPVGIGASQFRKNAAAQLLSQLWVSIVRGNISEIKMLAQGSGAAKGVDADEADGADEESIQTRIRLAKQSAQQLGAVIVATGTVDVVTDGVVVYCIENGHPLMRKVTGAGCQLSALTAAFAAAEPDNLTEAAAAAVCAMGVCGEIAFERMKPEDGNASYRNYVIDAMYHLQPENLKKRGRYQTIK